MDWRNNRIVSAINGTNPMVIKELDGGYVVFGDVQFLPGYCVLLPKREVSSLNDMSIEERTLFLKDMSVVGDAIIDTCNPVRINYDILGNTDKFLHAHIFPRYEWEQEERKKLPVWLYESNNWTDEEKAYNPNKHDVIKNSISNYLNEYYA